MHTIIPAVFLAAIFAAPQLTAAQDQQSDDAASSSAQDRQSDPTLPELRKELLDRMEKEQQARFALIENMKQAAADGDSGQSGQELVQAVEKLDAENRQWLTEIVEQHGWPGKAMVGVDGAHAAWLLVQHADRELEFQKKCLELMKAAAEGEVAGVDIAYLTDRVLCAENKPQLYGTQLSTVDGKLLPRPIEDEDNVDARRKEVGLGTLEEYVEMARKMYENSDDDADKNDADKNDAGGDGGNRAGTNRQTATGGARS